MSLVRTPGLLRFLWISAMTASAAILSACGGGDATAPAAIETQPADEATTVGAAATFSVQASGDGLTYAWQQSTDKGGTWTAIAGATSASYALAFSTLAMNGSEYRVVAQGSTGTSVTSAAAMLTVTDVPVAIATEPANASVAPGATAKFSVVATGTDLSFQWASSDDGGKTFKPIAGATAASYTTAATTLQESGTQFEVTIGNSADNKHSGPATVTVTQAPTLPAFTTQPDAVTVTAPAAATYTAVAGGSPAPTYQWQSSLADSSGYTNIAGATSANYTTAATTKSDSGTKYRVIASNVAGSATSDAVTLTVSSAVTPRGGDASQCIDASLLKAGYSYHLVTGQPSVPSYMRTDDGTVVGMTTFQGHTALEGQVNGVVTQPGITSETDVVSAYASIDSNTYKITDYGVTSSSTLTSGGTTTVSNATSVFNPPLVDATYTLSPGQTITQTSTTTTTGTIVINGVAQPAQLATITSTDTVTFVGVVTITVPAGTFQACRFDHSIVMSTGNGTKLESDWFRVGDGINLQTTNAGVIADQALSISTSGGP